MCFFSPRPTTSQWLMVCWFIRGGPGKYFLESKNRQAQARHVDRNENQFTMNPASL